MLLASPVLREQGVLLCVRLDYSDPGRVCLVVQEDVWFIAPLCINQETLVPAEGRGDGGIMCLKPWKTQDHSTVGLVYGRGLKLAAHRPFAALG